MEVGDDVQYSPHIMNADGSERMSLASGLSEVFSVPEWSFDGVHLAVVGKAPGESKPRLFTVESDGSDLHPVSDPGVVCCAAWRP